MTEFPAGGPELLNLGLSMLLVVGAIVVFGWLYSRGSGLGARNSGAIVVVDSRALGSRERLALVDVGGKQILLGITQTSVQGIHVFDSPVESIATESPETAQTGFSTRLRAALREIRQ